MIEIFTDGAYSFNNKMGGWAFYCSNFNIKVCGKIPNSTNNIAELTAVLKALEFIKKAKIKDATIYSDSMYVIGHINLNWTINSNQNLFNELKFILTELKELEYNIEFKYIKGHSINEGNNICDLLANFMSNGNLYKRHD